MFVCVLKSKMMLNKYIFTVQNSLHSNLKKITEILIFGNIIYVTAAV